LSALRPSSGTKTRTTLVSSTCCQGFAGTRGHVR
jgi:hypothetical protein